MFLHAQSALSHCWMDSLHLEIGIQTKYWVKTTPLRCSPGEKCLNLERYCSAVYYSDTFWGAPVEFNDKGLFFPRLKFFIGVSGDGGKKVFSDQWERWKQTPDTPWRTRVCINAWWDQAPRIFFVWESMEETCIHLLNDWGSPFKPGSYFFGVRRSKDPNTDRWDNAGRVQQ